MSFFSRDGEGAFELFVQKRNFSRTGRESGISRLPLVPDLAMRRKSCLHARAG